MRDLGDMDRRRALKMCALALGGSTAAASLAGCTTLGEAKQEPAFVPVDPSLIASNAREIAETLSSFLTKATTNAEAMGVTAQLLYRLNLRNSAMYGALSDDLDQFGHLILFNGGSKGFLRIEVHNDATYVEPLILRKGIEPLDIRTLAAGCTITDICTNTIDLGGGAATHDFTDQGAEDPGTGLVPGYDWDPRANFRQDELVLFAEILRSSANLLQSDRGVDAETLKTWLNEKTKNLSEASAFVGVKKSERVTWYDWLLKFSNGASAMIQTAVGDVQPVHAFDMAQIDPRNVSISFDEVMTNVPGQVILFPHVTQLQ